VQRLDPSTADSLADLLQAVHVAATLFCRAEMRAPWGFSVEGRDMIAFHLVISGRCCLELPGVDGLRWIEQGDLVLLPHGDSHVVRDAPRSKVETLERLVAARPPEERFHFRHGTTGPATTLICGGLALQGRPANPLVELMPRVMHLQAGRPLRENWLGFAMDMLAAETASARPGAQAVGSRLAEILFIEALRTWFAGQGIPGSGAAPALRDTQILTAVSLIHAHPEADWKVGTLARKVGMSRTAFAVRFSIVVGESPLHYVTRCRIGQAIEYLRSGSANLAEIAGLVGYASEAAFSRAFKRHVGLPPGIFRKENKTAVPALSRR